MVRELTRVSVDELAERTGASRETIRRDLTVLADEGCIRKIHGSALLPEVQGEGAFHERMNEARAEKRRVAERAAEFFERGDSLFVDTGTTTLAFAEALAAKSGLTVITNSTMVAHTLTRGPGDNKVFMLGGEYRHEASENVGPLTIEQVSLFNAQYAVITVGAITAGGIMDYSIEEVEVARAMVQRVKHVTVVADGSKFDRDALFAVCPWDKIHRLVVDRAPPQGIAQELARFGVELVLAPPKHD